MSEGNDKYVQLIRNLIPISELSTQSQTELINTGSLLNVKKKGSLFNQGDRDNFSYYLLEGEIELFANNQQQNVIASGSDRALYAMAQLQPRQFSAKAKTDSVVFQIQRDTLDRLMVMQQEDEPAVDMDMESTDLEVGVVDEDEDVDWMTRMLQSDLFARLPTANIGQLFALLTEVHFSKGDVVIKQGDPGDNYYIIQEGKCDVLRTPPSGGKDLKLATLGVGDSFGEEALVSDSIRNATIVMATDGILMELSKENFIELIKKPSLSSVSYEEAMKLIKEGAVWLDVRFKKEHESHAIADSVHIPLNMLRMQVDKLDLDKKYIVYCDTGGRSSTGAFLLAERAFDVCYLEGGIVNNPEAADRSEVTHVPAEAPKAVAAEPAPEPKPEPAPAPSAPVSTPAKEAATSAAKPAEVAKAEAEKKAEAPKAVAPEPVAPAPAPAPVKEDVVDQISRQNLDPDVKASVLEAELNRTNMELEAVEKVKQQADVSIKEAQAQVEKQLQEERAKIEQAKKEAEAEAIKLRQQEEEKINKMKLDAESRMEEEKQKLEEVYSRNAAEMEKIEQMKAEAEALVQQERERLAQAAEQARLQMEEAEAMKARMEAALQKEAEEARQQLEEAAALKKQMEESREKAAAETSKQLQEAEAIKNEIDALRKKEAEEAAQKLAEAQRMKEEVEASRQAMEEAEQKRRQQQEEMEQQIQQVASAKLEEERRKLSEEFARNNEELEQARREKAEAEAARVAAKEEAEKIIAEYKMTKDQSHAEEEAKLRAERIKLEEEHQNIKQQLLEVQKIKEEAEIAKRAAMNEVAELRAKQEADAADKAKQEAISGELKVAQAKLNKASVEIAQAQQAQVKAVAAKNEKEEDLKKKKAAEESLRAQMIADLSEFKREIEEEEQAYANSNTIMEKMRRIKESAEAAKREAKEKDSGLLDDIAAQLGEDS